MTQSSLTPADLERLTTRGLTAREVERQLALLRDPPPALRLDRPATVGDGIRTLSVAEQQRLAAIGRDAAAAGRLSSFVPASGAASRMFRVLLATRTGPIDRDAVAERANGGDRDAAELLAFLDGIERFAFYPELVARAARGRSGSSRRDFAALVRTLLDADGLGYADMAKGLVPFHRYAGTSRTAFEEHLVESTLIVRDQSSRTRLHFTVAAQHRAAFASLLESARPALEASTSARFEVGFSEQSPSSDTVAIDASGAPFRDEAGQILFRPGGHGALLENVNRLGGDLVLVKNIDNIVPDHLRATCVHWKAVLAGALVELQGRVFSALDALDGGSEAALAGALGLIESDLGCSLPPDLARGSTAERAAFARARLDRPLRVCGMVPASGETGGGPFWVAGDDGQASLQIVETAQIDLRNAEQKAIHGRATHFNPVDLACSLRDRRGNAFDLRRFVDESAAFISEKSSGGKALRALEHPGLWNGAMARWTTVFVEVPLATFNPVKTVNDLLRPEHQPPHA